MKPMEEQIILVTGSTDGIGKITARKLARLGATVLIHGRSPEKCETTVGEIREATGNDKLKAFVRNLSSLSCVRKLAEDIRSEYSALDILINNAGAGPGKGSHGKRPLSQDGHELCFAVNHLAPFLLTHLLIPILRNGSPARIVNVCSGAQQQIDFDNVMFERGYDPYKAYAQSKLALTMFTFDLAERLKFRGITANCLHPGSLLDTKMVREGGYTPRGSAESGAEVVVYVATSSELLDVTGQYFAEKRMARAHDQAYDSEARDKLWRLSEKLAGIGERGDRGNRSG